MKRFSLAGLIPALFILFSACTHDVSPIGLELNQELVGTNFTDTVTIEAYSVLDDTISTANLSANLIGMLHDPVFGNSTASTFAQFTLSGSSLNFGTNPIIDSVVLTLQISSFYGDTNSRVGIRVYQLTEALMDNTKYSSCSSSDFNPTPLNYSLTGYTIQPNSTVIVDTASYNPHLRIRLSQAFGQYLLNNQASMSSIYAFQSFFKGFCISATSYSGSTGYIMVSNMTSSLTGLTLYYHNNSTTSAKYTFPCNSSCTRYTRIKHDYYASTDNDFTQEVILGNKEIGKSKLFVQASGGVKTRIVFPHIREAFKAIDNHVVVNRAELVITNVSPDEAFLLQPASLSLQGFRESDNSAMYLPDDEYYTGTPYFGGTYDASKHEYRFRITEYIQKQIQGTSELANYVNLVVKGAGVRANRLIFGGTDLISDDRLRLELSYTVY